MQSFITYINQRIQLSSTEEKALTSVLETVELPKYHILIKEGLPANHIHFIQSGAARSFYYHNGKDITSWMYREDRLVTAWSSFFTREPAQETIELLENSTIGSISYDNLQQLYQDYPKINAFGRLFVEEQIVFIDQFYKGFYFMTAKEKYALLLAYFPDILQRVNLGHIASFLGISQETLSRIRAKK